MFLADLISNCFFEVGDVNILYFLGFQSFTGAVKPLTVSFFFGLTAAVKLLFDVAMTLLSFGESNGKH